MTDTRTRPELADVGVLRRTETFSFFALLVGGSVAIMYFVLGAYADLGYPYNTPFFLPDDRLAQDQPEFLGHSFSDYWLTTTHSGDPSPYIDHGGPIPSPYLPFAHIFLRPLTFLPIGAGLLLYISFVFILCIAIGLYASPGLPTLPRLRTALLLGVFSYPVLFLVDRGNFEAVVLAFVVIAGSTYERRPYVAAVAIAFGAAFKLFPLLLVALLLAQRRFRAAAVACCLTVILTLASAATFQGGLLANLSALRTSLRDFEKVNAGAAGLQHASDLAGALIVLTGRTDGDYIPGLAMMLSLGMLSSAALWVIWARPTARYGVSLLMIAMVISPHPAFDYRLVYLLIPAALFLRYGYSTGRDGLVSVLWVAALAPMSFPVLFLDVGFGVVLRPLLLLALAGILVHAHHAATPRPCDQLPGRTRDPRSIGMPEPLSAYVQGPSIT